MFFCRRYIWRIAGLLLCDKQKGVIMKDIKKRNAKELKKAWKKYLKKQEQKNAEQRK